MRPLVWNKYGHQESIFDAILLLAAIQKLLVSLQYIISIKRLKVLDLFRNLGVNIKFEALLIDDFCQHASVTHCLREKQLFTRELKRNRFWEYRGDLHLVHIFSRIEPNNPGLIEDLFDSLDAIPVYVLFKEASWMMLQFIVEITF